MRLNSKKYPGITYEKGEELFLSPDESGADFWISLHGDLTGNDRAMEIAAAALDDVQELEQKAKAFVKAVLADEGHERYDIVSGFMEFHKEELDSDTLREIFSVHDPDALTFDEMAGKLKMTAFSSDIDEEEQPVFITDLSFGKDFSDELLVVYFDSSQEIFRISHES